MRKKIFVYSVLGVLCAAGIFTGCKKQESSKQETEIPQETRETSLNGEAAAGESSDGKESSGNETVSGSAVSEDASGAAIVTEDAQAEERKKREEDFSKAVEETRQSYEKLKKTVDVAALEVEKGWEYAYFSPMLTYYEELAREGFKALTEEEISRAESGISEVRRAIRNWI